MVLETRMAALMAAYLYPHLHYQKQQKIEFPPIQYCRLQTTSQCPCKDNCKGLDAPHTHQMDCYVIRENVRAILLF
jgi:hypothetical protein